MRIAFDIDNTLGCIVEPARDMLAARAGIRAHEVVLTGLYGNPFTHPDPKVAERLVPDHAFWNDPALIDGVRPFEGAAAAVRLAAGSGMLAGYVTRRAPPLRQNTLRWLDHGGFPAAPVVLVGSLVKTEAHVSSKGDACRRLRATHLVDDLHTEIHDARSCGIEVVVVDTEIGRAARLEFLSANPGLLVAADVVDAVDLLMMAARQAA